MPFAGFIFRWIAKRARHPFRTAILTAFIAAIAFVLRSGAVGYYTVVGDAMAPTLDSGAHLLVAREQWFTPTLHAGEIVIFHPHTTRARACADTCAPVAIGRIVAGPGESLVLTGARGRVKITVAPGHWYVLGDNRRPARGSGSFGQIPTAAIVGVAVAVYWPWSQLQINP